MAAPAFSEPHWALCLCGHRLDGNAAQAFFASHGSLGYGQSGRGMVDEIEPCHCHVGAHRHTSCFSGYFGGQSVRRLALAGIWPQRHYFAVRRLVLGAAQQRQHDAFIPIGRALVGAYSKRFASARRH